MSDLTLCLCGDVMTGRGIDQILPHPGDPELVEQYAGSAARYVELAQARNGPIAKPVSPSYVWGDALEHFHRSDVRVVNLETSITRSGKAWPKGVHYRMNPQNIACIACAGFDGCALANNHVLDYGYPGLIETIETLRRSGIGFCGAGENEKEAGLPVVKVVSAKRRIVVYSFGSPTSGIPAEWAASGQTPGINWISEVPGDTVDTIAAQIHGAKREGDVVVLSIHWGPNFGYTIPQEQTIFARRLIDTEAVDVVHGHSSHHAKAIEVYRGKLILYGCGDFLNDYEGIAGYEEFRNDLVLMYLPRIDASGELAHLDLLPFRICRFRLTTVDTEEASWLCGTLNAEGAGFGTHFELRSGSVIEMCG